MLAFVLELYHSSLIGLLPLPATFDVNQTYPLFAFFVSVHILLHTVYPGIVYPSLPIPSIVLIASITTVVQNTASVHSNISYLFQYNTCLSIWDTYAKARTEL